MIGRKLLAVALAATLLVGGVAASGAAMPQDVSPANDHAQNDSSADADVPDNSTEYDGNDSAAEHGNDSAAEHRNGSAPADAGPDGEQGPPTDMPEQVPDHVVQIHQTINDFLTGEVDDLGAAISDIVGDDAGDADEDAESDDGDSDDAQETEDAENAESEDGETDDADETEDADDTESEDTDAEDADADDGSDDSDDDSDA
ncbi:hypothetical protein L593_09620 [Salinarchaeum sp. Harcht-Bsk1]|uniref:hypothetical protein n=1 Tax=Salinarchaeum sp. Harcht-Bsk1 TaxID=1333523 RepID=UPI00034242AD|nr:hypothetical protein [Salinarchaeum sp. Harcht-Bsk1]AGN01869.1 hypothetical protein L593_09620 [Salinarchaeum sp. Harcht-Bsk1]